MMEPRDLLNYDALAEAEKLTGKSYKEDDLTSNLGLLLHPQHVKEKKKVMQMYFDTYYSQPTDEFLLVMSSLGFEEVLRDSFIGAFDDRKETYRIMWHPKGILASVETYGGDRINSAEMFYNVEYGETFDWSVTSSGHGIKDSNIWVGDHDIREGARMKFKGLDNAFTFVNPWVKRPYMNLMTYQEWRDTKHDDWKAQSALSAAITEERILRLPEHIQRAITPEQV